MLWTFSASRNPAYSLSSREPDPWLVSCPPWWNRRNLKEHVRLAGFVPDADLPVAYRAANLSVVPSIALEGFGLVVLESLAAGTPVVVTPVGGLPEVVSGLSEDLILHGSSANHLAEGLAARLSALDKLPSEIACRAYAKDNFDWPVIAKRVVDVYKNAFRNR